MKNLLILATLVASSLPAQDATWSKVNPTGSPAVKPQIRYSNRMAYDISRDVVVMYGGLHETGRLGVSELTWEYDPTGPTWTHDSSDPEASPIGSVHITDACGMTYDDKNEVVLLFGGVTSSNGYTNEIFWYDHTVPSWKKLAPSGAKPLARSGMGFCHMSGTEKSMVIAGGNGAPLLNTKIFEWISFSAKTCKWVDHTGNDPALQTGSTGLINPSFCYDKDNSMFVLTGGMQNTNAGNNKTFEWDGGTTTNWVEVGTDLDSKLVFNSGCAYSVHHKRVVFNEGSGNCLWCTGGGYGDGSSYRHVHQYRKSSAPGGAAFLDISGAETFLVTSPNNSQVGGSEHGSMVYMDEHVKMFTFGGINLETTYTVHPTLILTTEAHELLFTYDTFHFGVTTCSGTFQDPTIEILSEPKVGGTYEVESSNSVNGSAAGYITVSYLVYTTPIDLTSIGAPGCKIYPDAGTPFPHIVTYITSFANASDTDTWSMSIANDPILIGLKVFAQAFVLDIDANALGLAGSDAIESVVGN